MGMNFTVILLAALVPLVVGAIWYHPKVMGTTWMRLAGISEEQAQSGNMAIIFGATYVLSILASMALYFSVVHQAHVYSLVANNPGASDPTSEVSMAVADFLGKYGQDFRTFKHGALHGFITALFLALPVVGINALFERRGWKYTAMHTAYWAITFMLMGGILCAYA